MSVLDTVRGLFEPPKKRTQSSGGAYWCDDCAVRLLEAEIEDGDISCPDCGEEMRFEKSSTVTGCC